MKKRILYSLLALPLVAMTSCNDFLDDLPDNRTEANTPDKIRNLLVSAYPTALPWTIHEYMSDNMTDVNRHYGFIAPVFNQAYNFKEIDGIDEYDNPTAVWEACYSAAAAANMALESIEQLGNPDECSPMRGEALLCRAYAHFVLANTFCQAYNPQSSNTDLGIPYLEETEKSVGATYSRGTVASVYAKIEKDIVDGLPLISDEIYKQIKYHFNSDAANAFAAQFYLYYGDYAKSIAHADKVLMDKITGTSFSAELRDMSVFANFTARKEFAYQWASTDEPANLMLCPAFTISLYGMQSGNGRYSYTSQISSSVTGSSGPWGNPLPVYQLFGDQSSMVFPKADPWFIYSDIGSDVGDYKAMFAAFTTDKLTLWRAEAYAMMNEFDKAAEDLSRWYVSHGRSAANKTQIYNFYEACKPGGSYENPGIYLDMNPRFAIAPDMQTNFILACLHARRIETLHEGTRLEDLKRFGVRYTHYVDRGTNIDILPYDERLALQLPNKVTSAGLPANPRTTN
ncbi:MAG: RagB/SusD family nutrient uptake outer membrane protein [Rikenellaceae bacterium]|jgi:hypothetical protein|nr:RagB/SusD family nutrient uptake outer membrane protein [Rikenellaceae bacterium]